jgi:hypothetical protein
MGDVVKGRIQKSGARSQQKEKRKEKIGKRK